MLDDHSDVPLDQCWYASPQLLFAPRDGRLSKRISDSYGEDDFRIELVFFTESTAPSSQSLLPVDLPGSGPMEIQGVPKVY